METRRCYVRWRRDGMGRFCFRHHRGGSGSSFVMRRSLDGEASRCGRRNLVCLWWCSLVTRWTRQTRFTTENSIVIRLIINHDTISHGWSRIINSGRTGWFRLHSIHPTYVFTWWLEENSLTWHVHLSPPLLGIDYVARTRRSLASLLPLDHWENNHVPARSFVWFSDSMSE